MKIKVKSGFSLHWLPALASAGQEIEVPDHREEFCRDLRTMVEKGLAEMLEPQKRPDYEAARKKVHS